VTAPAEYSSQTAHPPWNCYPTCEYTLVRAVHITSIEPHVLNPFQCSLIISSESYQSTLHPQTRPFPFQKFILKDRPIIVSVGTNYTPLNSNSLGPKSSWKCVHLRPRNGTFSSWVCSQEPARPMFMCLPQKRFGYYKEARTRAPACSTVHNRSVVPDEQVTHNRMFYLNRSTSCDHWQTIKVHTQNKIGHNMASLQSATTYTRPQINFIYV